MRYDDDAFKSREANKCIPFTNSKYILTEKNDATTSKTLHLILVSSVAVIFLTPARKLFPYNIGYIHVQYDIVFTWISPSPTDPIATLKYATTFLAESFPKVIAVVVPNRRS